MGSPTSKWKAVMFTTIPLVTKGAKTYRSICMYMPLGFTMRFTEEMDIA
jgi:hypothetical protein